MSHRNLAIPRDFLGMEDTKILKFLYALSRQNWLNNKKDIRKNIPQSRAKFNVVRTKKSRGMATLNILVRIQG